ncbi:GntR family transcriptional regulator [Bradyrhizobium sp. URHD0069]|jgi:DNA-binding GntR family transcriptional regulator|uniref:GntR family transcriptional regulator n=1 Tax=Bradyrhizobium sp. URHD0069 TaxID=1380355 RepID=UPI000A740C41|nr:GntR family transcriptional regulator [Bradyrhizobium sp. URHD0069]
MSGIKGSRTSKHAANTDDDAPRTINRPAALVDEVYDAILDRIMALKIQPGAKITVDNLARELGVSQTPIREALSRLEAEGLVLKAHLVGYSAASQLSKEQVEHLFEARLLLEPAVAAKAAARITQAEMDILRALHADMVSLRDNQFPAYGQFARKDAEFHQVISTAGGNSLLVDTLARLHSHVHIFRLVFHTRVTSEAIAEHADILTALVAHDGPASEKAMRAHILASRNRILTLVST